MSLLEKATAETIKQSLDALDDNAPEVQADLQINGQVDVEASLPVTSGPAWLRGGRVSVYVKAKLQVLKDAVGGVRYSKKF